MSDDNAKLLKRARRREAGAWTEIYDQFYPRVYAMLLTRIHNTMLAEDLTAEVFIRAMRSIDTYEERGLGLAAWLFRIAHNLLIDYYRRQVTQPHQSLDEFEETTILGAEITSPKNFDLQTALAKLNPEQRQIIHLRFVEGLTSQQVARVVGKTEAAVKIAQHRALKLLRQLLS